MKVVWTEPACEQLDGIYDYIARSSTEYAVRTVDRLTRRTEQIGRFPLSGSVLRELGHEQIREVIEKPYRIIYHVTADRIEILALVHGAREFPTE
jgi:toxin ParE1/3/4